MVVTILVYFLVAVGALLSIGLTQMSIRNKEWHLAAAWFMNFLIFKGIAFEMFF